MVNDSIETLFSTPMSVDLAKKLEEVLKRLVDVGNNILKYMPRESRILIKLEEEATNIIRGILEMTKPEKLKGVRQMDARKIWGIFWEIQKKPSGQSFSIFDLLVELDRNSSPSSRSTLY